MRSRASGEENTGRPGSGEVLVVAWAVALVGSVAVAEAVLAAVEAVGALLGLGA